MNPGFSTKLHGVVNIMRRTPLGPRTDFTDHVRSLGVFEGDTISIAMAEHTHFENHVIRRALALVHPHGRESGEDVFWIVIDRVTWKRGWPEGSNEPNEMIETVFPFHAPGCGAKISEDGRSVWSLYDGPDRAPYKEGGASRLDIRTAHEQSDSDANLLITRVDLANDTAQWDIQIREGWTNAHGEKDARPMGIFRWRGKLPHWSAYVLVPYRGVRVENVLVAGVFDSTSCSARVTLNRRVVYANVTGIETGVLRGEVTC